MQAVRVRVVIGVVLWAWAIGCGPSSSGGDLDAAPGDAAIDDAPAPIDTAMPTADSAPPDAAMAAGTCETCTNIGDCLPGYLCQSTGAGFVCLPECTPATPDCPVDFTCAGVKATYCAPIDGVCCVDGDDDGWGDGVACFGADCDDTDPLRNPGEVEECDGFDNDCDLATSDGQGDPSVGAPCDGADSDLCTEGIGSCGSGFLLCSDGSGDSLDLCNGVDDDCNAATPDGQDDLAIGVPCDGGDSDSCAEGFTACTGGGAVTCLEPAEDDLDLCNGVDDDCNAATVDGAGDPGVGPACDGSDTDLCLEGAMACTGGMLVCADGTNDSIELCNGVDDDCIPGSVDGSSDPAVGISCDGGDTDLCVEGVSSCSGGIVSCSDTTGSSPELCNGADDDCNTATADGSADPGVGAACDGSDTDLCTEGTATCVSGGISCSDTTGNAVELCNGVNDDCNGSTADGSGDPAVGVGCDGPDGDFCAEGVTSCAGGGTVTCSDATGTTVDLCNGVDDDCSAATADGSADPGVGAPCDGSDTDLCAEGTTSCVSGGLSCSDATGNAVELCNGLNDDCNGATADGAGDPAVGLVCDGPDGDACTEGVTSCSGGGAVTCSDTTGTTVDLCNGVDDDCNPATPDGSADPGVGVACDGSDGDLCAEGTFSCSGGGFVCSDATSTTIDICNGLNDDCDAGSADGSEDPGLGVACDGPDSDLCLEGVVVCSTGTLVCSDASADDVEVCNGADDDCDGLFDEGFDLSSDVNNCGVCGNVCSSLCCAGSCTAASATNCGACGQVCTAGMLVVTELLIDPNAVADTAGEWLEIYNPNAFAVDLRGFVVRDLGADTHTITSAAPVLIPAGSYAVLAINSNFASNGGVVVLYQYASFTLGNSGDEVLIDAFGTNLDTVVWPGTFDVLGRSKELSRNHLSSTLNDVLTNWCTATSFFNASDRGTPGVINTCSL